MALIPNSTQERAQQKYRSINNDKIDDKEENRYIQNRVKTEYEI